MKIKIYKMDGSIADFEITTDMLDNMRDNIANIINLDNLINISLIELTCHEYSLSNFN